MTTRDLQKPLLAQRPTNNNKALFPTTFWNEAEVVQISYLQSRHSGAGWFVWVRLHRRSQENTQSIVPITSSSSTLESCAKLESFPYCSLKWPNYFTIQLMYSVQFSILGWMVWQYFTSHYYYFMLEIQTSMRLWTSSNALNSPNRCANPANRTKICMTWWLAPQISNRIGYHLSGIYNYQLSCLLQPNTLTNPERVYCTTCKIEWCHQKHPIETHSHHLGFPSKSD